MRTTYKFFAPLAVALLAFFGVSGCGGGNANGPVSVTVTPSNPSIAVSTAQTPSTLTFTANVTGGTTPVTVTWSVMGAGTIDATTGVYTAPMSVPATNDIVTATSQGATGSASVNVTASQALQIMPGGPAISAGAMETFTATSNGNPVGSITWQVNGLAGGDCVAPATNATTPCHGTISSTGNYTAPLSPPPGGVTITATSGTDSGSTNPTILYSSASLTSNGSTGQYAFQFSGSDFQAGFPLNVAGSITTSGSPSSPTGTVTGGELDISSVDGVTQAAAITAGTITVNPPDGRATVTIASNANGNISSSFTLQLVLTTNQHGLLIDVDTFGTGSGTIDAQNTASFANSLNGNYSFSFSGLDPNLLPMFGAGTFLVSGNSIPVNVPASPTNTQDLVDRNGFINENTNVSVITNDITLSGALSPTVDNFGRGTIQMSSTPLGIINFSFYMIDQTHANMLETDTSQTTPLLFGQIFSAPNGATPLMGGVAFTAGGSAGGSAFNPYVIGGVFPLSGSSVSTGGVIDVNTSGGAQVATGISSGSYTNSTATGNVPGRFMLTLTTTKSSTPVEFAAYTTTVNTALLVEIDNLTDGSTGTAFQQSSPVPLVGSFATNLQGVGASKQAGPIEQDVSGQIILGTNSGTPVVTGGNLDLNSLAASGTLSIVPSCTPTSSSCSSFTVPTNNRGTAVIKTAKNIATFNLTYYLVSPTTALYIDTDSNRVAAGIFLDQF